MKIRFTKPTFYDAYRVVIGENPTSTGTLAIVASSTAIGSYPDWISDYDYPSGVATNYYAVQWEKVDGSFTAWSNRFLGRIGAYGTYQAVYASGSYTVYLVNPVSGDTTDYHSNFLEYNKEYTITVHASGLYGENTNYMEDDYTFSFTSVMCPLWSTATMVRLMVGPYIENLPDDTINRIIFNNSRHAWAMTSISVKLSGASGLPDEGDCGALGIDETIRRYVTCKSALDALNAAALARGGNSRKQLGDFSIQYTSQVQIPGDMRKTLMDCAQAALRGFANAPSYAVPGISNVYVTHPYMNAMFGRMPRTVDKNRGVGPWSASTDYKEYTVE